MFVKGGKISAAAAEQLKSSIPAVSASLCQAHQRDIAKFLASANGNERDAQHHRVAKTRVRGPALAYRVSWLAMSGRCCRRHCCLVDDDDKAGVQPEALSRWVGLLAR